MNIKLLEQIAQKIEAHPETYEQANWCGTACCIAGHACALAGIYADDGTAQKLAEEALELTEEESNRLFLGQSEGPFEMMWDTGAPRNMRAKAGAARIRHFIATEGRE